MSAIEFRFRGGRLCLDFMATVLGRHREPVDQLLDPVAVGRWFVEAGLASEPPWVPASEVMAVHDLREAGYRLVHPATRAEPRAEDIRTVNHFASHDGCYPVLGADARTAINQSAHPVQAGLATVARDVIGLLASADLHRVRECARPNCSVLFFDGSRAGRRLWCEMTRCGNQAKAARHRNHRRLVEAE